MCRHRDPAAPKDHSFGLETHALFQRGLASQENAATGTDHTMPWQTGHGMTQSDRHAPRRPRKSGGLGDVAIGGDFAFGNSPHLGLYLTVIGQGS